MEVIPNIRHGVLELGGVGYLLCQNVSVHCSFGYHSNGVSYLTYCSRIYTVAYHQVHVLSGLVTYDQLIRH